MDVPPLGGRVNDLAGLLPAARARALEEELARFEAETTHQIAVLTIPSTEGEAIADFAIRVFEAWRLGHEGLDNGVLLVVAPGDRAAWITTGYGLEGAIPDVVAARIVRERMIPRFRKGQLAEGIETGVEALMEAARSERVRDRPRRPLPQRPAQRARGGPLEVALFCGVLGSFLGSPLRRRRRRMLVALGTGAAAGVLCYLLVGSLVYALLAFGVAGVLGWVGPPMGTRLPGGPGGWGRGRFSGGGFGGGGFGGGGFSGGGGFTGGGGAGGRW